MNFKEEIFNSIQNIVDRAVTNCKVDRTYESVIKRITKKGYEVLNQTGSERTVQCCIPGVELKVGQSVWIKEPMGEIRNLHIVGVIEKVGNSGRRG